MYLNSPIVAECFGLFPVISKGSVDCKYVRTKKALGAPGRVGCFA